MISLDTREREVTVSEPETRDGQDKKEECSTPLQTKMEFS